MTTYKYHTYQEDEYGQLVLTTDPIGSVKLSIGLISQTTQQNILYKDATYIGLTHDKEIDDSYVIQYGNQKLKVLYVNPFGRFKQVFMRTI